MWYNPLIIFTLRSPLHLTISKNTMLMTYTGRKSGRSYTTPMNYLQIGDALYTLSSRDRVWWRNLRGGADVTLRVRGKDVPASSETIEEQDAVADTLAIYLQEAPQLAKYLNVRIGMDGAIDAQDLAKLAREKVMVRSRLK